MKYGVRIILSEIEIEADSKEEAEEIALDVYDGDGRTHLDYGLAVDEVEVEELE